MAKNKNNNNNGRNNRKNFFQFLIEIFFFFFFSLLLFLVFFNFFNSENIVTWYESDLDRIFEAEKQIKNVVIRPRKSLTIVDGVAIDEKGEEYKFVVNIDTYHFNKDFIMSDGRKHAGYYSYFKEAVEKTRKKNLEKIKSNPTKEREFFLKVELKERKDNSVLNFIYTFLFILLEIFVRILIHVFVLILVVMLLTKKGSEKLSSSLVNIKSGFFKEIKQDDKNFLSFNDIAGYEEIKKEVATVIEYLKNPTKFIAAGAKMPRGILLFGPPGVGKTLLAKAVAGEAKVPFFFVACTEFLDEFFSVSAKKVKEIFSIASKRQPSIIFIDEIDMAGKKDNYRSNNELINQLLVEMDSFKDNSGVVVFAATNRIDLLDPSILRAGRFDKHIEMQLPYLKDREKILACVSRNKKLSSDVDFKKIARLTYGCSGADISSIMNDAAIISVIKNGGLINSEIIDEAIDKKYIGLGNGRYINKKQLELVAFHEAGHAVVGIKLGKNVEKITILNRGNVGGYTLILPNDEEESKNFTKKDYLNEITILCGGRACEETFFKEISDGAASDIKKATNIAYRMVRHFGMSSSLLPISYQQKNLFSNDNIVSNSEQTNFKIDQEVEKIIESSNLIAKKIIKKNEKLIKKIAKVLLEQETIFFDDIKKIVEDIEQKKKED